TRRKSGVRVPLRPCKLSHERRREHVVAREKPREPGSTSRGTSDNVWEVRTVKSSQRHAAIAASLLALSLVSVPAFAQARNQEPPQRGGPPGEKTPYILVTTFASADRKLGVESANEMRHRLQSEHSAKELYVVPKANIDNTLAASGYPPDSALNAADLMELSKQLHGEYVLDSKVTKTGP